MTTAGHTLVPRFLSDFIRVTVTILEAIVILGGIGMAVDCMHTTILIPDHMRIATIIRGHIMPIIRRARLGGLSPAGLRSSVLPFPLRGQCMRALAAVDVVPHFIWVEALLVAADFPATWADLEDAAVVVVLPAMGAALVAVEDGDSFSNEEECRILANEGGRFC